MKNLTSCLACGGTDLFPYLDLGMQPLANSFHEKDKPLPRFPLAVRACKACWHSQLTVAVDPSLMFDDYLYVSGTSQTLRDYFASFAARFNPGIKMLDIASNDGSLMRAFEARACFATGVEPCGDLVDECQEQGLDVEHGYWNERMLNSLRAERFDMITAFNVLAHVADPLDFLLLAKAALKPDGEIWVQTSQSNMVLDGTFDAVYHEHVSYFTPRSITALARRAGLYVALYEKPAIHGGSMLVCLRDDGTRDQVLPEGPLCQEATYRDFAKKVQQKIAFVKEWERQNPGPLVGYGAAAKGMTFLAATGLRLDRIVDDNALKHGLLAPAGDVPIGPVEGLAKEGAVVVLAWNFWDEIIYRVRDRFGAGVRLVRFLPAYEEAVT